MAKICLGSVVKVNLNVDGLTGVMLTDESVDAKAYFYGADNNTRLVVINKTQMVNEEEGPSNDIYCIVNTSTLATGALTAEIEITYPVEGSSEKLVQRSVVTPRDADGMKLTLVESSIKE